MAATPGCRGSPSTPCTTRSPAAASLDPEQLTEIAWERFADTSDLSRPHGSVGYSPADAARKVADKLRLLSEGRLPARDAEPVEAAYQAHPSHAAEGARAALDAAIADACRTIEAWHLDPASGDAAADRAPRHRRPRQEPARSGSPARAAPAAARGWPAVRHPRPHAVARPRRGDGGGLAGRRHSPWPCCAATRRATRSLASRCARTSTRSMPPSPRARRSTAPPASAGAHRCALFDGCLKQRNRREVADRRRGRRRLRRALLRSRHRCRQPGRDPDRRGLLAPG